LFKLKEFLDLLAFPVFLARGRKPWGIGYYTAKKRGISSGIDSAVFAGTGKLPDSYGQKIDERVVEYPWVFAQLPHNPGRVLDAGSALNHQYLVDRRPLNQAELTIMTLAPEKRCFWSRSISYVFGDLRSTKFASDVFDIVISVSTIEHIGLDNTLLYTADSTKRESDNLGYQPAVSEFKRVLRPGGLCLITVPFGRSGVHEWYQVFDKQMIDNVVHTFDPSEYSVEYFGYDAMGWRRVEHEEIKDAEFFDIHERKAFAADYAAGARGVACIKLTA